MLIFELWIGDPSICHVLTSEFCFSSLSFFKKFFFPAKDILYKLLFQALGGSFCCHLYKIQQKYLWFSLHGGVVYSFLEVN